MTDRNTHITIALTKDTVGPMSSRDDDRVDVGFHVRTSDVQYHKGDPAAGERERIAKEISNLRETWRNQTPDERPDLYEALDLIDAVVGHTS